jgi:hypothetical protein
MAAVRQFDGPGIASQGLAGTFEGYPFQWALARTPRAEFVNVVARDEFTHDVIVRVTARAFVVFDTT